MPVIGWFRGVSVKFTVLKLGTAFALTLFTASLAAEAQTARKDHRVGVLCGVTCAIPPIDALRQGLRDRGYVEGQNITFEYRSADGKYERFPGLAADLVALQVDVIVAGGGLPGALAAKAATRTIPIVFVGLGEDPVQYGLVQSLARPGGNVTGLVAFYADLVGKQLELITEAVPGISRVTALWDVGVEKALEPSFKSLEMAGRALGLQPHAVAVRGSDDFARVFREAAGARAQALILLPSPAFFAHRVRMANLAAEHRLPVISPFIEFALAGGVMAYGPNITRMYGYAAGIVDRILKGARPANLPVEQPTKFELVINLKTAKALGLTIPQSVLVRAEQLIE
jgi:putative ABC transport system substrate-binding protein